MGEVEFEAHVKGIAQVDREKVHPQDVKAIIERKVEEALERESVDLTVKVWARDR